MKIRFILFLCIFFITKNSHAQNHFTLKGTVIDKETKEPLAFAHIGIPSKGIGTATSDHGEFSLKIPRKFLDEELTVSFIGYETFRKKVNQLDNPVVIEIESSDADLIEIEVLGQTAVENIIRKAVKRIPKNYPTHSHTDLAFYRESRTDTSSKYIYLAEGVLNVYKRSYKSKKEGQVSLVQGRKINLRNPLDTIVRGGFSSGHMAAHRLDFVYNREDFLQEKFFPVYDYWIESMTTYNGNPVYIIAFNKDYDVATSNNKNGATIGSRRDEDGGGFFGIFKKRKTQKIAARMKGKIYIDKKTYAIIRGEFEITKEGLEKYNNYPLYSGYWKGNSYVVNYQQLGDKWFFSDAFRKGKYGRGGIYTNEVKITEIHPEKSSPIPYQERMHRNQAFSKMTGVYDADFWKNYNTTPMNAQLAASVEQLQNAKKAREALDPVYLAELQLRRDSIQFVKRQKEMAKEKEDINFDFSEEQYSKWKKSKKKNTSNKRKKSFTRTKFMLGLGTHFISTDKRTMGISLLTDEEPRETILTLEKEMKARNIEITGHLDFDYFFTKNLFTQLGVAFDFADSRYKERSVGLGFQMNLTKQRPFFMRIIAQYSNLRYFRKVGLAKNNYGKFRINKKTFKANNIKLAYGSLTRNLKLSTELAIELNPAQEFYIRGTYFLPFSRKQKIWMQERKELFRKKRRVNVDSDRVLVTQNSLPFDGQIIPNETIRVAVGMVFK